jgi:formate hydrogenlyase subunit 5
MIANLRADEAAELAARNVRDGARFLWLFCESVGDATIACYVVDRQGRLESFEGVAAPGTRSLSKDVPASRWYEQEARYRYGVDFGGPSDEPSIVKAPEADAERMRRALGDEVSTVLYGPIRSGIVESACWVIETAGEDFICVHPSMFFKHRGLEKRFEGVRLELAPLIAEHVSGVTPSSHATAFCRTVEAALGIDVPKRARAARAILVELERIHQHLDSLAKLADDGSLSVGSALTFAAKERVHRMLCDATGHRFARGSICIGGVREDVFSSLSQSAVRMLDDVEREALSALDGLFGTQSLMDRLVGTGRLSQRTVSDYGGVGPVARGSGVVNDARLTDGWLYTRLEAEEARETEGDALARARVREAEIRRSFQHVRNMLDAAPAGPYRSELSEGSQRGEATAFGRVESPQGELIYFVRYHNGLRRVAIRSASFANWPLFVPSLPGNIFTDFSFIEHSFGLVQAETDR